MQHYSTKGPDFSPHYIKNRIVRMFLKELVPYQANVKEELFDNDTTFLDKDMFETKDRKTSKVLCSDFITTFDVYLMFWCKWITDNLDDFCDIYRYSQETQDIIHNFNHDNFEEYVNYEQEKGTNDLFDGKYSLAKFDEFLAKDSDTWYKENKPVHGF